MRTPQRAAKQDEGRAVAVDKLCAKHDSQLAKTMAVDPSMDFQTVGGVGMMCAVAGWMAKQLWGTKPDMRAIYTELDRRFTEFEQEDAARDLLMIGVVRAELQGLKDLRKGDHELMERDHELLVDVRRLLLGRRAVNENG